MDRMDLRKGGHVVDNHKLQCATLMNNHNDSDSKAEFYTLLIAIGIVGTLMVTAYLSAHAIHWITDIISRFL